ncbi:MAG: enoyl-CoA hydratase/isomerase family protein [Ignavibacteriae bacterium]|nr:enoyl-CoA hydratase/isomerase family protein [Ignavibacteriota bacterium]
MEKINFEFTHNDSVAKIVLNDGKGNVLDAVMMNDLHSVFADFKKNSNVKFITFEGEGKHFSFGASVPEHTKSEAGKMLESFHRLFYELIDLSIPAMAKISGQCLGGGMELALICNFLFADKTAKMGQPEIILGVFPPPASLLLPLKIGWARAEDLLITGKTITAEEAKSIGLINELFEDKSSMEAAFEEWLGKNILPKSASSLRYSVKAARIRFNRVIKKSLPKLEQMYLTGLMETGDANEGINAFCEKRSPVWKNM